MLTSGVLFQRRKKIPQLKMQVGSIQCEQEQAIKIKICLLCNFYALASLFQC